MIVIATSEQMGFGPILVTGDCDIATGICPFQLFCLQLVLFKISCGTCQNAAKTTKSTFSMKKKASVYSIMVSNSYEH